MPAALIDSTIVLRLIADRLAAGVTVGDVTQLGEPPVESAEGVEIRVIGLRLTRERRNWQDGSPADGTFEAMIEVVVDADVMSVTDSLTRNAMKVVAALDQQRLYDAATTHELLFEQVDEDASTADSPEDRVIGYALLTASGRVRRESGRTVVA